MTKIYHIISLLLICTCYNLVASNKAPSCLMPCHPSVKPLITKSSLHHISTYAIESFRLSSILNGMNGELKILLSSNKHDRSYSTIINVKEWHFDEVRGIMNNKPTISSDQFNSYVLIKFPFNKGTVGT